MTTAGEFAAQLFIQTWFLRRKRGLQPPKDRRCVDFARLVIMCCDLARLGDYELLANLWACVLHRYCCRCGSWFFHCHFETSSITTLRHSQCFTFLINELRLFRAKLSRVCY